MVHETKKGQSKAHKEDELPLIDEVNQLIEKERMLLQLKLVEQQRIADEWKSKYDSLVGTATQGKGSNKTLQKVGEENDSENVVKKREVAPPATSEGIQQILIEQDNNWILDLSNLKINNKFLSTINSEIFSVRGMQSNKISVVNLRNCHIDDECVLPLVALVGKSAVQALDLSINDFTPATFQQFIGAMRSRRKSPQYLLLNSSLTLMTASAAPLLSVLTNDTWGIHLSLQDTSHGQLSETQIPHNKKVPSTGGKDAKGTIASLTHTKEALSAGLYTNVVHPHKTLEAIKTLCDIINPPDVQKGKKGKDGKMAAAASAGGGIVRTSKITTLTVLGLTHAHMCMESVNQLGNLLEYAAPSLTDIDLSFSYIGQNGANMLRDTLTSSGCQIIKLTLQGNNLGDSGITALSNGLNKNKTLTYLDARTNQITHPGLRALCYSLTSAGANGASSSNEHSFASVGGGNCTLSTIDISGNLVSQSDIINCEKGLRDWGVSATLKCIPSYPGYPDISVKADIINQVLSVEKPSGSYLLYQEPNKIINRINADFMNPGCKLYSVDLKYANTHYAYHKNHPLVIEWCMRPGAEASGATAKDAISGTGGNSNSDEPWLQEQAQLRWELHLETSSSNTVIMSGEISNGTCMFNQQGEESTWARCQAFAYDIPMKGTLELHVYGVDGMRVPGTVEACDLSMYSVPPQEDHIVGGDFKGWSGAYNSTISIGNEELNDSWGHWCNQLGASVRGYELLRAVQWNLPTAEDKCLCQWQSKLQAIGSGGVAGSRSDATMGYSWMVLVASGGVSANNAHIASQGAVHNTSGGNSTLNSVLEAWTWRDISAILPGTICTGDILLIAAKPQSPYEGSIAAEGSDIPCGVRMRNMNLCTRNSSNIGENEKENENATGTKNSNGEYKDTSEDCAVGVFAVHNPTLTLGF
jgi:hypothetical protein